MAKSGSGAAVALRAASRRGQRGMALLAMVAIVVMGAGYMLASRLNAASRFIGIDREYNARVLNQAKQALIGYVAQQATLAGENNPGRLPCPEAGAFFGDPAQEGIAAGNCTLPAVGRLPWRTLGLEKLVDANTEPLWYVVSPGWALSNATVPPLQTLINSGSVGQLTVDGVANDSIALIIAPGAAMIAQAGAGCTAWVQARPAVGAPDLRNYLECDNATSPANATFVTSAPGRTFNDQVLRVTAADLLPAIEAAIAHRIEREIAPALRGVYSSNIWGLNISSANPVFPFAAPFLNPTTSNFQGALNQIAGLLPFNQTQGCNPATDPRCTTTLTGWASPSPAPPPDVTKIGGYGSFQTKTCTWQSGNNVAFCQGEYREDSTNTTGPGMVISMTATINNVAMGLRVLDTTKATIEAENNVSGGAPLTIVTPSITATMNSNGSVTITFSGTLPNIDVQGWDTYADYRIRLERSVIGDHALLDPANATTGWFARNEWYRLLHYATVAGHSAAALPAAPSCTTGGSCISVVNGDPTRPIAPAGGQRAILIFAGSSVVGQTRPSATPSDYFEFGNATGTFERQPVKKSPVVNAPLKVPFNDRIIVVGSN